jgi:hypothetical protein
MTKFTPAAKHSPAPAAASRQDVTPNRTCSQPGIPTNEPPVEAERFVPLKHRPLNQREIDFLRGYMSPVRLQVEERRRHVRLHPPLSFGEIVGAAVMLLVAFGIGWALAVGGI